MRIQDAILGSVTALILVPVLLPLSAVFLISVTVLFAPAIAVFAAVALATLLVLTEHSKRRHARRSPVHGSPITTVTASGTMPQAVW